MNKQNNTKKIAFAALLAAIYATLTVTLNFMSYGPIQIRIAEGLTVLPYFSPYAIWGLFLGCLMSNIISPMGIPDLIVGSLATLLASYLTYKIGKSNLKHKRLLAPLPAVLVNAIVVGSMLKVLYAPNVPLIFNMFYVGIGQFICCYGLGLPLISALEKNSKISNILKLN
ncbi:QueT transporter family protein [Clostridium senegalense]|uniref:QueT transporter family protein n=1 Tax=Clostridium senegalense TaxID=1465809 RepID=UPI001C109C3C|nr:QueT transporter family protein [Clostridium senegalense]MBU5225423.1 QueT transporter family protein [Clostridium senegalense]